MMADGWLQLCQRHVKLVGLLIMTFSGFMMSAANTLVQCLFISGNHELSTFQIVLSRALITFLLTSAFMVGRRVHPYGRPGNLIYLIVMGAAEAGGILAFYLAMERMPVGDATVVLFTKPMFTFVFSYVLFGERCSIFDAACGAMSFIGVLIMCRPSILFGPNLDIQQTVELQLDHRDERKNFHVVGGERYLSGISHALLAAILFSLYYALNKWSGQKCDVTLAIFYPSFISAVSTTGIMLSNGNAFLLHLPMNVWVTILWIGTLSFVALYLMAEAFQMEDATPCVLVRNVDVVYAFVLQFAIVNVTPTWPTIAGAVVVVVSSSAVTFRRLIYYQDEKDIQEEEPMDRIDEQRKLMDANEISHSK